MVLSVSAQDEMLWKAETSILRRAMTPTPTSELVRLLKSEEIDEYFVRAAILFLMDRGRLRMTDDRKLLAVSNSDAG